MKWTMPREKVGLRRTRRIVCQVSYDEAVGVDYMRVPRNEVIIIPADNPEPTLLHAVAAHLRIHNGGNFYISSLAIENFRGIIWQ